MLTRRQFTGVFAGAAALAGTSLARANGNGSPHFQHGIASGDPLSDRVILWTRVSGFAQDIEVEWQVASDAEFRRVAAQGRTSTGPTRDHTVKVDATGLAPGQAYFYRFRVNGAYSPLGRTATLDAGKLDAVRLAVVSCSNYPAGYFHVYRAIGLRDDIDAVIHLGDYLYEYGADGYASGRADAMGRTSQPAHAIVVLQDYRTRHAQYKSDPDLQLAHGRHPFITMWDDHEIANDAWSHGAENHDSATEGDYLARRDAAMQAYYEWMPIRPPADRPVFSNYRSFQFGDLATLAMIETRLTARAEQLNLRETLPLRSAWFDFTDAGAPAPVDGPVEGRTVKQIPVPFEMGNGAPTPILDYGRISALDPNDLPEGIRFLPDAERFRTEVLAERDAELVGAAQFNWLEQTYETSRSNGTPWQVLGNQVMVADIATPDFTKVLSPEQIAGLIPEVQALIPFSQLQLPLLMDVWDGYPRERERLYQLLGEHGVNNLVLTGDIHTAWGNRLRDSQGRTVGFEVVTSSVTSPGFSDYFGLDGRILEDAFRSRNPHVEYAQMSDRGYALVTLTHERAQAEWLFVDTVHDQDFTVRSEQSLVIPTV